MSENHKRQLEQQLWNIANTLRGKMDADEFRDYILGFIFYKYLSEKMELYANKILAEDGIKYSSIDESTEEGQEYLEAIKEEALASLGYFLKPSELFRELARKGNSNSKEEGASNFILDELTQVLKHIEQSTMGTESEDDFNKLFEDLDLTSTKLGRTEAAKNDLIAKVLGHLDKIDFKLEDTNADVLGDAYEYLIGQFASGAGKKAGEFYTPQEVSKVLAKLVTTGKDKLKSVYDPTCGSGSLLLRVAREVKEVSNFYGQELNRTTYNLARMNMILHDVHFQKFDIRQEDTLEHPQHLEHRFEAIVANPPFSANWSASPLHLSDDRFSQYGKLAPSSKADFAFVQHMIHHLADNGTMAVVLPHGVLFRGAAEGHIRQYLIEDRNYLDAVIGLPANIFYGTGIPTCILVFKKCREYSEDILFIDASQQYEKAVNQNLLRQQDIDKIISTYIERREESSYSCRVSLEEIKSNNFKLNLSRYIDSYADESPIDLDLIASNLDEISAESDRNDILLKDYCYELGIHFPNGYNLSLLREYKKGVLQLIFGKKVRFRNNQNEDFPDWTKTEFGELTKKFTKKNKDLINATIYSVTNYDGFVVQSDHFDKGVASADLSSYKIVQKGDFAYNPARINVGSIGYFNNDVGIISSLYVCFKTNDKVLDDFFLYLLQLDYTKYQISTLGEGGVRVYLWYDLFALIKCEIPCIEEQEKIVSFLKVLDKKIEMISRTIKLEASIVLEH